MRLLICFDRSEGGTFALEAATRLFPGAQATVVNVWRRPMLYGYAYGQVMLPLEIQNDVDAKAAEHSNEVADSGAWIARAAGLDAEPSSRETDGPVWREVLAAADSVDADVIVMGTRGFGEMKALVVGSTSAAVVHHSSRPVLIVPAPS